MLVHEHAPEDIGLYKKCWVKCGPNGLPCYPLEVYGLPKDMLSEEKQQHQSGQDTLSRWLKPGPNPEFIKKQVIEVEEDIQHASQSSNDVAHQLNLLRQEVQKSQHLLYCEPRAPRTPQTPKNV
eukprot:329660-Amphidinium_carterae.1